MTKTKFVLRTSCAQMPVSCWGRYMRIGIMEVEEHYTPTMISDRPKQVVRVVETWERLHVGVNAPHGRCAYSKAYKQAQSVLSRLNDRLYHLRKLAQAAEEACDEAHS